MLSQFRNKLSAKIPLRIVFIVPFVIQVVLVVGLVGYLSFRNGQQAVNNVTRQLRSEIAARIEEHLYTFLGTPHQINQVNANAIRQGLLDANDANALERHFWEQIQIFDSVTSVYFGNTEGGLADAGREGAGGSLYVIATDGFASGPFRKYATDSQGNRTDLLTTIPDFDARTRSWYSDAVEKAGATWSDIYILFTGQDMAISASRPVYDERQTLLGVVSDSIFVSHISDFLKGIEIGETGQSFIMERSGLLVASSTDEQPFTEPVGDQAQRRLHANESEIPIIHYAADFLTEQFGDYHNITARQQLEFEIEGQRRFLHVSPIQDEHGIDWLIVMAIPESDFMAQINANNRTTALLIGAALIIAVLVGTITTLWVTRPILRLKKSAQALAKGDLEQTVRVNRTGEMGELMLSFNNMARQLKQTLDSLKSEIAERKQVEEALRESEGRYRSVVEDSPGLLCSFRPGGIIDFVNDEYCTYFGKQRQELIGKDFLSLIPEEDRKSVMSSISSLTADSPVLTHEHKVVAPGGEIRWQRWTNRALCDEEGRVIAYQSFGADITDRKQAEEALRIKDSAIASSINAIAIADLEGNLTYVNPSFLKSWGYDDDKKVLGVSGAEFWQMEERVMEVVEALREGGGWVGELVAKRQDGSLFDVQLMASMVTDEVGAPICMMASLVDITERKRAEESLRESEARYRELFDNIDSGVAVYEVVDNGQDFIFRDFNRAGEGIDGEKREDLIGRSIFDARPGVEDFGLIEVFRRVWETGQPEHHPITLYEDQRLTRWYENFVYKLPSGEIVAVFDDATDRKQAEAALKEYSEQLEAMVEERTADLDQRVAEADWLNQGMVNLTEDLQETNRDLEATAAKLQKVNQELKDFAYIVSHDLKAPLRGITQLAGWISEDYADALDTDGQDMVQLMISRTRRMHNLIEGILQYSRVGRITEREREVDLNRLVLETIEVLAPPANVQITVEDELPAVVGERTRFRQVFQNLVDNAIKFMEDKPRGRIGVGCVDEGAHWLFSVSDNGPGIEEKYYAKIFQMFQSLAPRDEVEGSGVGLALVKKIVEGWGGGVWVESTVGEGSTFYFTLPKK